jgi:predicted esterase
MNSKKSNFKAVGLHQFDVVSNFPCSTSEDFKDVEEVFVLFHGFSEKAATIYKRLGDKIHRHFESHNRKVMVMAPNGLYAMPHFHPLEAQGKPEDLLKGYSWYFYHQGTDTFLIDYDVPAVTFKNWIESLVPKDKPVTLIGYSQGGYLSPFVGIELKKVKKVIGINCSFREEKFSRLPDFPLYQFQGDQDTIIDIKLSYERFQKILEKGLKSGDYIWAKGIDHKLTPELAQMVLDIL